MSRESLVDALGPVCRFVRSLDLSAPDAAARMEAAFPSNGPELASVRALVRRGVEEGWLCERENAGVRFSRVAKAMDATAGLSIDAVHMQSPGPGHTHPNGEVDLCFPVEGAATFDGRPAGWTVYPPGSWHVPTVAGGSMDILYFLPEGAITFGPRPA